MKIAEARIWARDQLQEKYPELSAEQRALEVDVLLAHALGVSREYLIIHSDEFIEAAPLACYQKLLSRRCSCEPVAYLLGEKEFYSLNFSVTKDVLIPRPETELLVDRALAVCQEQDVPFVCIDVGCGSGAIILSLLHTLRSRLGPSCLKGNLMFGLDISKKALAVAEGNAEALGLSDGVAFIQGDLLSALNREQLALYRPILLANLPYIPESEVLPRDVAQYEPEIALRAGVRGLDVITRLIEQAQLWLRQRDDGVLALELGHLQYLEVESLLRHQGLENFRFIEDLQGIKRIVEVRGSGA